jgi:hypothetical protein
MAKKIKVNATELIGAIAWVTKDMTEASNGTAPVVFEVLTDGTAAMWHNGVSYMRKELVTSVAETGDEDIRVLMDGKYLKRLGGAVTAKDGDVTMTFSADAKSVLAKTANSRFSIPVISGKVPTAPVLTTLGEVDDNEFFSALTRVAKLCEVGNSSSGDSFLSSVDIGITASENAISMFATDRYALGQIDLGFTAENEEAEETHILLPAPSASMVAASKGASTPATLVAEQSKSGDIVRFGYEFVDSRVALFSLSMATPFSGLENMKKGASAGTDNSVIVSKVELANAVKTVSSLAWNTNEVYLTIKDSLTVADPGGDTLIKVDGKELTVSGEAEDGYRFRFVNEVIMEAILTVTTAEVKLKWSDTGSTFLFVPLTETGEELEGFFLMCIVTKED